MNATESDNAMVFRRPDGMSSEAWAVLCGRMRARWVAVVEEARRERLSDAVTR